MRSRSVLEYMIQPYLFDSAFLEELRKYFPFLANWSPPELGNCHFALGGDEHPYWMIHFLPEGIPIDGVREVWVSNGTDPLTKLEIGVGDSYFRDIIPDGTKYIILKFIRCSPVRSGPPDRTIIYTLHGKETVVYPLEQPNPYEPSEVVKMIARECGIAV